MTYRLKFDEPAGKGWRRIVREQIDSSLALLRAGKDIDAAVHETRKSMKRVRALLRLLRPGLTAAAYKRENQRYRDIARILSGVRDQTVVIATAEALSDAATGKVQVAARALITSLQDAEANLAARRVAAMPGIARTKTQRVAEAIAALEAASRSLDKLKVKPNSFVVIRRGLERSYRAARSQMKQAFKGSEDEPFHDWRKSVQAHWRHMLLVSRAWPELFEARAQLAKETSDLLGLDHDLFTLIEHAEGMAGSGANAAAVNALVRAARLRQDEIREELRIKGAALFAESTKAFVSRIDVYWTAAKDARRLARKRRSARKPAPPLAPVGKPAQPSRAKAKSGKPARRKANGGGKPATKPRASARKSPRPSVKKKAGAGKSARPV